MRKPDEERYLLLDSDFLDQNEISMFNLNKLTDDDFKRNQQTTELKANNNLNQRLIKELALNRQSISQLNLNLTILSEVKDSEMKTLIEHK
jgi:hypothetical protein